MSESGGLCRSAESVLVVIDIQQRLAAAMPRADLEHCVRNTAILLQAAAALDIPVFNTEQYPRGLGETLPELQRHRPATAWCAAKTGFSCCAADGFSDRLDDLRRRQVVLTGMESHICVLQTAFDLQQRGFDVQVAADAVCARSPERTDIALQRLRTAGITVTHSESVLFEWLRDAGHPQFRYVSALLK
jgi:nicotinamidase-related amidase